LRRIDPASAARIQVKDQIRVVRALEVYYQTGRTLTAHFAETRSPLAGWTVVGLALCPPWPAVAERIARRVALQFERGIVDEVRRLLASGVPATARPFSGYVYLRVCELLAGVRDEAETRDLITRENRQYARRQLIWFRKEPNLVWIPNLGDDTETIDRAVGDVVERGGLHLHVHADSEGEWHAADV
jgi:tRNA dimethylallyltransferase